MNAAMLSVALVTVRGRASQQSLPTPIKVWRRRSKAKTSTYWYNMANSFLHQPAPPELLVLILQHSASPEDSLAFALTCRHMTNAWHSHAAGLRVAWEIVNREVPAAEEALIAVSSDTFRPAPMLNLTQPVEFVVLFSPHCSRCRERRQAASRPRTS